MNSFEQKVKGTSRSHEGRAGSGISGSRVPENFSGTRTQNWVRVPENIALWVVSFINGTCKR